MPDLDQIIFKVRCDTSELETVLELLDRHISAQPEVRELLNQRFPYFDDMVEIETSGEPGSPLRTWFRPSAALKSFVQDLA